MFEIGKFEQMSETVDGFGGDRVGKSGLQFRFERRDFGLTLRLRNVFDIDCREKRRERDVPGTDPE